MDALDPIVSYVCRHWGWVGVPCRRLCPPDQHLPYQAVDQASFCPAVASRRFHVSSGPASVLQPLSTWRWQRQDVRTGPICLSQKHLFKSTHIFLTKTHSAKNVLTKELDTQSGNGRFTNLEEIEQTTLGKSGGSKQRIYTGEYKLMFRPNKRLIFGTIDSFLWAFLPKQGFVLDSEVRDLDWPQKAAWLAREHT